MLPAHTPEELIPHYRNVTAHLLQSYDFHPHGALLFPLCKVDFHSVALFLALTAPIATSVDGAQRIQERTQT
jgi:hypothetical protein